MIKLYVWEGAFVDEVQEVRNREVQVIQKQQWLNVWTGMLWTGMPVLTSLVAFVTLGLCMDGMSTAGVFAAVTLFDMIHESLLELLAAMAQAAKALVSLGRIQHFLQAEELQ